MDETSLRMWPGVRKGLVSRSWKKTGPYPLRVQRKAGLSLRRSAISYVAFIADDDTVQETLPQILIGNEHLLTRAAMDELNAEPLACRGFFLLRRKSAWLDAKCLVRLIRLLGEALRPLRENYTFLFCMDGCPTHTALPVLREIRRQRLHLFYIPVSMTGFLQPLDTHVFSLYKRFLIAEHEQKALSTVDGNLSVVEIIKTMMRGIRDVIQGRSWRQAFEQVGLGKRQRLVSPKLRESLGYASDPLVPDVLPSYAQWRSIFRHGALIPFDLLLGTSNHHAIDPPQRGPMQTCSNNRCHTDMHGRGVCGVLRNCHYCPSPDAARIPLHQQQRHHPCLPQQQDGRMRWAPRQGRWYDRSRWRGVAPIAKWQRLG